jgi:hypothetical protein
VLLLQLEKIKLFLKEKVERPSAAFQTLTKKKEQRMKLPVQQKCTSFVIRKR